MEKTYSDFAYEKIIELLNNHDHEVGSNLKNSIPLNIALLSPQTALLMH